MHRIDGAGHVDHMFVAEDPATLRPPTEVTPEILNAVQEELATFIEWAGVVLAKGDNTQLRQALVAKFAGLDVSVTKANLQAGAHNTAVAGGTADAITAAYVPAIAALTNGMTLYVRSALANATTTPTFTPNNGVIAGKAIVKGAGTALAVGDIAGAGHWIALQYDQTLDKLVLLNPATGVTPPSVPSVQGSFKNLQASATGTNATVSVSYDELVLGDGAGSYITDRNAAGAINTTVVGAGGLDTGALAASTWYSVWRIGKTDGTRSWLISLSATAPTMPAGYTHKARVGWIRSDGSANKYPYKFKQNGRSVQYALGAASNVTTAPVMASGTAGSPLTPTWVSVAVGAFVPPTAAFIDVLVRVASVSSAVSVAPNDAFGATTSGNPAPIGLTIGGAALTNTWTRRILLESTNIYWASSDPTYGLLACLGWEDNL